MTRPVIQRARSSGLPLAFRNTADQVYSHLLRAVYMQGVQWIGDPDFALSRDTAIWEKIQRDPVVAHAINMRIARVTGMEWGLEAPGSEPSDEDKLAAEVTEQALLKIENLTQARLHLAKGVVLGRAYGWVQGKRETTELAGKKGDWWTPVWIKHIDRRRIRYRTVLHDDSSGDFDVVTDVFDLAKMRYHELADRRPLMRVVFDDEEGRLGYGRGLIESIYHYFFLKGLVLREGIQGLERWAQGLVAVAVKSNVMGAPDKTNASIAEDYLNAIDAMRARHALVFDAEDTVTVHEPKGTGHQMVKEFLEYFDRAITQLLLGSVLPTGGGANVGSNARAEVEDDSTDTLVKIDRMILDDALTNGLVRLVWEANRTQRAAVGLEDARMPRWISRHEKKTDPAKAMEVIERGHNAGLDFVKAEVYKDLGYSVPAPGDDVFEGREMPDPMALAGIGGPGGGAAGGNEDE